MTKSHLTTLTSRELSVCSSGRGSGSPLPNNLLNQPLLSLLLELKHQRKKHAHSRIIIISSPKRQCPTCDVCITIKMKFRNLHNVPLSGEGSFESRLHIRPSALILVLLLAPGDAGVRIFGALLLQQVERERRKLKKNTIKTSNTAYDQNVPVQHETEQSWIPTSFL